jgi:hypothetical protein
VPPSTYAQSTNGDAVTKLPRGTRVA